MEDASDAVGPGEREFLISPLFAGVVITQSLNSNGTHYQAADAKKDLVIIESSRLK